MTAVDESKQMDFIGQVIGDREAMASVPVGELPGLSRAIAGNQPVTAGQLTSLASRHGADAKCVGVNWLRPRALSGVSAIRALF